jgi:DNA-binding NarL/FixJ family response regulator
VYPGGGYLDVGDRVDPANEMTSAKPITRCVVADDHPAILESITQFLAGEGIEVVARAREGHDALAKIEATRPTVAVVDLSMPGLGGIDVAREAARVSPETRVVIYTGHTDSAALVEAVDAGAAAFVLKEAPLADLLRAIDTVVGGGSYVDPVLAGILTSGHATGRLAELTAREREILRLLADGLRYEEIGKQLFIAPETVRTHVNNAMRRLEANTRTQAVATALRLSLIA